jgi:RNA polymerase sigma-70 factor (ECF subfamily)
MTDEELMLAVCNGDQSAYQTIVKKHLKPISHYAFRMLGNSKDTEEISQETFLRLWRNAARWQPAKSNLSTWLHRIAHNLCIDYLRKHSHVQIQADPIAGFAEAADIAQAADTAADIDASVAARQIHRALQELPESQRSALMLCHYQGFSNKEAAAIMDISVKALESAIARAKRTLRIKLSMLDAGNDMTDLAQTKIAGQDAE